MRIMQSAFYLFVCSVLMVALSGRTQTAPTPALRGFGSVSMLAQTLADSEQPEEAIELFWRLYERLEHFPAKLSVIEILANEYTKLGRVDELVERLQMLSRNFDRRREAMQALARVFLIQNDLEEAHVVLENMLDLPNGKDESTWALRELVGTAEKQNDFSAAVRYQEMLCQQSSDAQEQHHLFYLYDKLGDTAKTKKLFFDQVLRQSGLQERLGLIDTMIRREQYEIVAQVLDFLEIHEPERWEIMFRRILVEAYQNKPVEWLVREFRSWNDEEMKTGNRIEHNNWIDPPSDPTTSAPSVLPAFIFFETAPAELKASLLVQNRFLPVLFYSEAPRSRQGQGQTLDDVSVIQTLKDARFLVLGFLLREAMRQDISVPGGNLTVMRQFRNTIEELRDMFPVDSAKYDVLMERLRLEIWLLDLLHFDTRYQVFPTGILKLQIDDHVCQRTIWQIVRKAALDGAADWQPALFQILVTECINELVAERFKMELASDAKLAEKLSQILDNICYSRKIPPIPADERNQMLQQATYLVKRSAVDHQASLAGNDLLTLSQKTDRLLSIWNNQPGLNLGTNAAPLSGYAPLLWIVSSQNREDDVKELERTLRKTAQCFPLWFAANLTDCTQLMDTDSILFLSLRNYDSLEAQLHRIKTHVTDMLESNLEAKQMFSQLLFQHFSGLMQTGLKRYDIFTPSEQTVLLSPTPQLWSYLHVPTTSQEGRFVRQFFGIDSPYSAHQQVLNSDQMSRLVELDRSLRRMADFVFHILDELKLKPADWSPSLSAHVPPPSVSLSRYRTELQGDRPVDRTIIYSLLQNPAAVGTFSAVDEFFCRILLLCRGLDVKTQFAGTRIDGTFVPIREHYTEQFVQFLENKTRSSLPSDRSWSQHISATLGDLMRWEMPPVGRTIEPSSDAELLQLVRKLETADSRQQTAAEQLALALLYIRLQRFSDAAVLLDSMELTTADLPVREWIIACLTVQYGKPPDSPLHKRGGEAADRLLNFRLSERDSMDLVPILRHFQRDEEAQRILDHLAATVADQRLLSELFYRMNSLGDSQKENAAKIAQRILINPAFLQNSRRLTSDSRLFQEAFRTLQEQHQTEAVLPALETRLRNLRDRTDSRILLAQLYQMLDRKEEAKALALELAQNPTAEPERRQMIVAMLLHFGLQRELEAMNRQLLEQNLQP